MSIIDPGIDEKWKVLLEHARSGDASARRYATRFALVHAFGDEARYNLDAEFHARVCLAESMLLLLDMAERSS